MIITFSLYDRYWLPCYFLILDLLVCFPVSFRNECQYKASLDRADDAEEDEEAGVSGEVDDGSGDLNRHECHKTLPWQIKKNSRIDSMVILLFLTPLGKLTKTLG